MPRMYYNYFARDSNPTLISHPLNVRADQFASQSTVHSIALLVFFVNNVMLGSLTNRGADCFLSVKIVLTISYICATMDLL